MKIIWITIFIVIYLPCVSKSSNEYSVYLNENKPCIGANLSFGMVLGRHRCGATYFMGISKKIRFEVFKRDSFKCQYCGRCAPDVILEVDHIKPKSKKGEDTILNYVTSCFDCNRGKSDRELSDNSVVTIQRKQIEELQERRNQIEMMLEWKSSFIENENIEVEGIAKHIRNVCGKDLTDSGKKEVKVLIKKYGFSKVVDATTLAWDSYGHRQDIDWFDKIGGILYTQNLPPIEQAIVRIKGIAKNFSSYFPNQTDALLRQYFSVFDDYDEVIKFTKQNQHYRYWYDGLVAFYNENKPKDKEPLKNW